MKKPKKAKIFEVERVSYRYDYQCPHCKTLHQNYGLSHNVLRILCSHCKNPIDLEW